LKIRGRKRRGPKGRSPRPERPRAGVGFLEMAFPGISKASGQAPEATYYEACNFYTVKKILVIISEGRGEF